MPIPENSKIMTVQTKYGPDKPTAGDLEEFQLGFSFNDNKLWIKNPHDADDPIKEIGAQVSLPIAFCSTPSGTDLKVAQFNNEKIMEAPSFFAVKFSNKNTINGITMKLTDFGGHDLTIPYPVTVGTNQVGSGFVQAGETHLFRLDKSNMSIEDLTATIIKIESGIYYLRGGLNIKVTTQEDVDGKNLLALED